MSDLALSNSSTAYPKGDLPALAGGVELRLANEQCEHDQRAFDGQLLQTESPISWLQFAN